MQYKANKRRLTKYCCRGVPMISMYLSGASRSFGKTWILLAPLNFFMWAKLEACLPIKGPANLEGKVRWILTGTWSKKKKSQNRNFRSLVLSKMNKVTNFLFAPGPLEHIREDLFMDHFTFACLVAWPLYENEVGGDIVTRISCNQIITCRFRQAPQLSPCI